MGLEKQNNDETEDRRRLSEVHTVSEVHAFLANLQASLQDQGAGRHEEMAARTSRAEEQTVELRERLEHVNRENTALRSRLEAQDALVMQAAADEKPDEA